VSEIVRDCEVCLHPLSGPKLDLGSHPLCDDLIKIGQPFEVARYHQELILCNYCLTAQQLHQVKKEKLFKADYHYRASLTKDVIAGMSQLVAKSLGELTLKENPIILDIGCNDGTLLGLFKEKINCLTIGVDPTNAIQEAGDKIDLSLQGFFDKDLANLIYSRHGFPDVITFTNVFAHIEKFQELLDALRILIGPKTNLIIENHYLGSILETNQIDTFYHEHPRTYSARSFEVIASSLGLNLNLVEFPSRYGGNIRVRMSKVEGANAKVGLPNETGFVAKFQKLQSIYDEWLVESKVTIEKLLTQGPLLGKSLPGRAVMLISALGLTSAEMPFVLEQPHSPKVGFYVPGTDIQIVSDDQLEVLEQPNLILWAWHISGEVIPYILELGYKGSIWVPLPTFAEKDTNQL